MNPGNPRTADTGELQDLETCGGPPAQLGASGSGGPRATVHRSVQEKVPESERPGLGGQGRPFPPATDVLPAGWPSA